MNRERDAGFLHADVDTNFYSDPKIVQIAKSYRDPAKTAAAATMYHALVLASWRQGERVRVDEAAPAWWLEPINDIADMLHVVGLTDIEGRIPQHAWDRWYGPAFDRRENRRESGRKGGLVSPKQRSSDAQAALNQTDRQTVIQAIRPSDRQTSQGVCPICGDSLAKTGAPGDVIAAKKGREVHDVHARCYEEHGDDWWKTA